MIANYPDLEGKTFLVTGASRGIGASIATFLHQQKANLILTYRKNPESLNPLLKELGNPQNVYSLELDLENPQMIKESLENFFEKFFKENPTLKLDGLINNAGVCKDQLLIRMNFKDIEHTFTPNLIAPSIITSVCARQMLRQQSGAIVNISSVVGLMGNAGQSIYAASKAAIIGLTKSVAKELASKNIRCNAIAPGFIQTDMTSKLTDSTKEKYMQDVPLKRLGTSEDVAASCAFLLSQSSNYITGQVLQVDGGLYI